MNRNSAEWQVIFDEFDSAKRYLSMRRSCWKDACKSRNQEYRAKAVSNLREAEDRYESARLAYAPHFQPVTRFGDMPLPKRGLITDTYNGLTDPRFLMYETARHREMLWREIVLERQHYLCGICNLRISGSFEMDHKVPKALGGSDDLDNLHAVHKICNNVKSAHGKMTWEEIKGGLEHISGPMNRVMDQI